MLTSQVELLDSSSLTLDAVLNSPKKKRPRSESNEPEIKHESIVIKKQTRNRQQLSCGECRRLKLKCDRAFPCKSCVKRGCSGICPDGTLTSGKGTRYILANTEKLHDKILQMSERIRELEVALESMQSKSSSSTADSTHLLLSPRHLLIKNHIELYTDQKRSCELQAIEDDDTITYALPEKAAVEKETFFGHTARLEYLLSDQNDDKYDLANNSIASDSNSTNFSSEILPLSWVLNVPNNSVRRQIRASLPPADEALYICEQIKTNAFWQYTVDSDTTSIFKLHNEIYSTPSGALSPHKVSLFLMFLAIGCLVDLQRPANNVDAARYHQLSRAVLCEGNLMEEVDINTIQTLFMMTWYSLTFREGKRAISDSSLIMGLAAKLAHIVGLHRNSMDHKLMPDKLQEKRILVWELMYIDARLSLSSGRPPSFALQYTDCQRPRFRPDKGSGPANISSYYFEWKHSFLVECLYPVIELTVSAKPPEYSEVIRLDRAIREHHIPIILKSDNSSNQTKTLTMQQGLVNCGTEITILQLHRGSFTQALSDTGVFSISMPFAPSILATFCSSCALIQCLDKVYSQEPGLASRVSIFWSNAFSAAIALCLLVSKLPASPFTTAALRELSKVKYIFGQARSSCPMSMKFLPILEDLIFKLMESRSDFQPPRNNPENIVEAAATSSDRLNVLVDKATNLTSHPSSGYDSNSAHNNIWHQVHPSLLTLWDELITEQLSSIVDQKYTDEEGKDAKMLLLSSQNVIDRSWAMRQDSIDSLIASINSDSLYGSFYRKQPIIDPSLQPVYTFNGTSHEIPGVSWVPRF